MFAGLFGIIQYGVHVNGYTKDKNGELQMWIAKRSKTKQTFPDMYDNMVSLDFCFETCRFECDSDGISSVPKSVLCILSLLIAVHCICLMQCITVLQKYTKGCITYIFAISLVCLMFCHYDSQIYFYMDAYQPEFMFYVQHNVYQSKVVIQASAVHYIDVQYS